MQQSNEQLLGYIKAKVEDIEHQMLDFRRDLEIHLKEEMAKFDILNEQVEALSAWKIKVSAFASAIGLVCGFVIEKLATIINI
jgi:hypothetical protein